MALHKTSDFIEEVFQIETRWVWIGLPSSFQNQTGADNDNKGPAKLENFRWGLIQTITEIAD